MRIFLCLLLLTELTWAEDQTLVDPMPHPDSAVNQCHDFSELENLTGEQLAWMHCTPMALSLGISAGKGVIGAAAGPAVKKIMGKAAGKVILGLNIVGVGVTAFEIARMLGALTYQSRQCQLYEHDYKLMLMDAVDHRGDQILRTLEGHGMVLTEQEKRQLKYPSPHRERKRLESTTCGDVTLMTNYMDERQNRVAINKIQQYQNKNGVLLSVKFPDPPKREISQRDQTLIQELATLAQCLPASQKARIFCSIGNLYLLGKQIPSDIKNLTKSPNSTRRGTALSFEEIQAARQNYLRTQLAGNMRFPQTEQGIVGVSIAHLLKNGGHAHHFTSPPTKEELDFLLRAANKTHGARGINVDLNRGDLKGMFNTARSISFARLGQIQQVLARVNPRLKPVNPNRLSLDANSSATLDSMAGNVDRFRVMQSPEGQKYLEGIGESMHEAFWSPEMKALTTRWQASYSPGATDIMPEPEFTRKFRGIIESHLKSKHPELSAPLDRSFLQQVFPDTNITPAMAQNNSAAMWMARLFSLEYR